MGYAYLWEFTVSPERVAQFEQCYGQTGPWVALFRQAPGYQGTLLLRDHSDRLRFLTLDRWASEAAFRQFRTSFAREYEALDARCEGLTLSERALGAYEEA